LRIAREYGEVSIYNPEFASLSVFDIEFVSLSKYNLGHANSFHRRDSSLFFFFLNSNKSFALFRGQKKDHTTPA
jgi:hypothetical protein